jgi:hypothetical protein
MGRILKIKKKSQDVKLKNICKNQANSDKYLKSVQILKTRNP